MTDRERKLARKRENQRLYRLRHPDRVKASKLAWRRANREKENARKRAYRAAHPESHRANGRVLNLRSFGLTVDDYEAMSAAQSGVCAICGGVSPSGKRLAVDHDHATGKVRGLLCVPCNAALATIEAHPDTVLAYLGWIHGA